MVLCALSDTVGAGVTSTHIGKIHRRREGSSLDTEYFRRFSIAAGACHVRQDDEEYAISCLYTNILTVMDSMGRSVCSE